MWYSTIQHEVTHLSQPDHFLAWQWTTAAGAQLTVSVWFMRFHLWLFQICILLPFNNSLCRLWFIFDFWCLTSRSTQTMRATLTTARSTFPTSTRPYSSRHLDLGGWYQEEILGIRSHQVTHPQEKGKQRDILFHWIRQTLLSSSLHCRVTLSNWLPSKPTFFHVEIIPEWTKRLTSIASSKLNMAREDIAGSSIITPIATINWKRMPENNHAKIPEIFEQIKVGHTMIVTQAIPLETAMIDMLGTLHEECSVDKGGTTKTMINLREGLARAVSKDKSTTEKIVLKNAEIITEMIGLDITMKEDIDRGRINTISIAETVKITPSMISTKRTGGEISKDPHVTNMKTRNPRGTKKEPIDSWRTPKSTTKMPKGVRDIPNSLKDMTNTGLNTKNISVKAMKEDVKSRMIERTAKNTDKDICAQTSSQLLPTTRPDQKSTPEQKIAYD